MMRKIEFVKAVASGNDFIILDYFSHKKPENNKIISQLAKELCARKLSIGADGLLLIEAAKKADLKMRIFNPDGREAEMCGNGARCAALWAKSKVKSQKLKVIKIETKAGIIDSKVNSDNVKIKLTDPKEIKLAIPLRINNRQLKVNFINTGVPHTVIFVEGLDEIDLVNLGRQIRFHQQFKPAGTNVDFVEIVNDRSIKIRTYERGVEDETLACGTGAVASALITSYKLLVTSYEKINVHSKSGEILKVYFDQVRNKFTNVWLEGKAKIVYRGTILG